MVHVKRSAYDAILAALGVPADRSVYLQDYGHLGHTDPYLCLKLGLEEGKVKPGDRFYWGPAPATPSPRR